MQEKRGILGGEKDNMVKSQPKKGEPLDISLYNIIYSPIWNEIKFSKLPKIIYYELRIWKNHEIVTMNVYTTLKSALNYYKRKKLDELEDKNQCYVEIVKIDNLNPRYK